MKNRLVLAAGGAVLSLTLAGCGGSDASQGSPEPGQGSASASPTGASSPTPKADQSGSADLENRPSVKEISAGLAKDPGSSTPASRMCMAKVLYKSKMSNDGLRRMIDGLGMTSPEDKKAVEDVAPAIGRCTGLV